MTKILRQIFLINYSPKSESSSPSCVASKEMFLLRLLGCWTDWLLGSTPNLLFPSSVLRADIKSPAAFSVSLFLFVSFFWAGFNVFLPLSLIAFVMSWGWDWEVVAELGMLLGGGGGVGGLDAAGKDRGGAGGGGHDAKDDGSV